MGKATTERQLQKFLELRKIVYTEVQYQSQHAGRISHAALYFRKDEFSTWEDRFHVQSDLATRTAAFSICRAMESRWKK